MPLIDIEGVRRLPISCIEDTESSACMDELGPVINYKSCWSTISILKQVYAEDYDCKDTTQPYTQPYISVVFYIYVTSMYITLAITQIRPNYKLI